MSNLLIEYFNLFNILSLIIGFIIGAFTYKIYMKYKIRRGFHKQHIEEVITGKYKYLE